MITVVLLLIACILILVLWFFLFPVRSTKGAKNTELLVEPPDRYVYSYVLHIHTQFSYDSLGKPEDVMRVRDSLGIDYAIVTDHENDHIKAFADERLIAGKETKLHDEEGKLAGDVLEIESLKVIAHHFKRKYRWRLERKKDFLFELIDLRDAFLESKLRLLLYIVAGFILYPLLGRRILRNFTKLIDTYSYAKRYLEEGWRNRIVGGLDHHVKLYLREVGKRILVPGYDLSFSLMRNFLLSDDEVKDKEDFILALQTGTNIISFSEKPSFVWMEEGKIKAYSPFNNTFMIVLSNTGKEFRHLGPNLELPADKEDCYIVLGYNYIFKVGRFLFGVRPLFVSDVLGACDA